jgi:hypothetical protein
MQCRRSASCRRASRVRSSAVAHRRNSSIGGQHRRHSQRRSREQRWQRRSSASR